MSKCPSGCGGLDSETDRQADRQGYALLWHIHIRAGTTVGIRPMYVAVLQLRAHKLQKKNISCSFILTCFYMLFL